jgi:hypothetical protein
VHGPRVEAGHLASPEVHDPHCCFADREGMGPGHMCRGKRLLGDGIDADEAPLAPSAVVAAPAVACEDPDRAFSNGDVNGLPGEDSGQGCRPGPRAGGPLPPRSGP